MTAQSDACADLFSLRVVVHAHVLHPCRERHGASTHRCAPVLEQGMLLHSLFLHPQMMLCHPTPDHSIGAPACLGKAATLVSGVCSLRFCCAMC